MTSSHTTQLCLFAAAAMYYLELAVNVHNVVMEMFMTKLSSSVVVTT